MKKRTAELILKDPEKFAHHDRVFLNNPVVMQGMGLAPLVVVATTGQNGLMLAAAVTLLLAVGLNAGLHRYGDLSVMALDMGQGESVALYTRPACSAALCPCGTRSLPRSSCKKSCCPVHFCMQPAPLWCIWRHIPF